MNKNVFNQQKAEKFVEHLLTVLNHAAIALMISVGHRTGLFDVMRDGIFADSESIAKKAGLNERYVREWLKAMVTGGILNYDLNDQIYSLPQEHAAFLTRQASPNNVAVFSQFIPVLASVEDEIVEAFKKGGGVPYESYHRFHQVMAEESSQTVLSALIDTILPLIPEINHKLTKGIKVLDIGCGYGRALLLMAKTYPNSIFYGYDLCNEAITQAKKAAAEEGIKNIDFYEQDLSSWNEEEHYDLITGFDVIHDQAKPEKVLKNVYNALKTEGIFLMQDINASSQLEKNIPHPLGPFIYTISCMHCMTVSLAQEGAGLGAAWGEELAEKMLYKAGFQQVEKHYLEHDILNTYFVISKGRSG